MASSDSQKWVTSDLNFYDILGIEFETCTESELRRAYRKTALKYHPDKVGPNYDAEKYEIFQAAYQVLNDTNLKSQYDQYRRAKIQRQRANDLFEGKRKQMKEDLEAREKSGIAGLNKRSREDERRQAELQPELRKLAEEGRKRRAARASMMAERPMSSSSSPSTRKGSPQNKDSEKPVIDNEDDERIKRLEQRIREAEASKALRKAKRKLTKSGHHISTDDDTPRTASSFDDQGEKVPYKSSGSIPRELKQDKKPLISPKPSSKNNDFAVTMARLRAAEKARLQTGIKESERV